MESAQELVDIDEKALGRRTKAVAEDYSVLADVAARLGKDNEALAARKTQFEILSDLLGEDDWNVADLRNSLEGLRAMATLTVEQTKTLQSIADVPGRLQTHLDRGELDDTIHLAEDALNVIRDAVGNDSPMTICFLYRIGRIYQANDNPGAGTKCLEEILAIHQRTRGADDPQIAIAHVHVAIMLDQAGELKKSRDHWQKALDIRVKTYGEEHRRTIPAHREFGKLLVRLGDYPAALAQLGRTLSVLEDTVGVEHPETLAARNNVATVRIKLGEYVEARALLEKNRQLVLKEFGNHSSQYADTLNNLASLYHETGDLHEAMRLIVEGLKITDTIQERESLDARTNMGAIQLSLGEYAGAKATLDEVLAERERLSPSGDAATAATLVSLGNLLHSMGQLEEAADRYDRALDILRRTVGESHPDFASVLNGRGMLRKEQGDLAGAKDDLGNSIEILEKAYGANHLLVAKSEGNLATILLAEGDLENSKRYFEQSLDAFAADDAAATADTASAMINLATWNLRAGNLDEAQLLQRRARDIRVRILGSDNLAVAEAELNLAAMEAAQGAWDDALDLMNSACAIQQRSLEEVFFAATEPQMRAYMGTLGQNLDAMVSLVASAGDHETDGLTWVLRRKAIIYDALCRLRNAQLLLQSDQQFASLNSRRILLQKSLAALVARIAAGSDQPALVGQQKELVEDLRQTDQQLRSRLAERMGNRWSLAAEVEAVRERLPRNGVLVEIVKYTPFAFSRLKESSHWEDSRYAAFVLPADSKREVKLVDLGGAALIDALVDKLSDELPPKAPIVYASEEAKSEQRYREVARRLSQRIWDPLVPSLAGARRIVLSPDDRLHQVPFEALVNDAGDYLVDTGYEFNYLVSGRDLLRTPQDSGEGVAILAGPNFDLTPDRHRPIAERLVAQLPSERLVALENPIRVEQPPPILQHATWGDLSDAEAEGRAAARAFGEAPFGKVQLLVGDEAVEEAAKVLQRPRILVFCTHAAFINSQDAPKPHLAASRGAELKSPGTEELAPLASADGNPLSWSLLALAGANKSQVGLEQLQRPLDDGRLMAHEIADLDLRGTDLVVLSACETGKGSTAAGEAVTGMRSAFLFAGARTLLASLFSVPSRDTRDLMQHFYKEVAKDSPGPERKLAALSVARKDYIKRRRAVRGTAHPYYWAGFILVGDP